MRIITVCLMLAVALSAVTGCTKKGEEPRQAVKAGAKEKSPAPEFTVSSLKNVPVKLSELKGKVVLLNFWATWCPPCKGEIPSMMKLNSMMAGKPFQMLAVSIDAGGAPDVESYFKESGNSLPAYLDPESKLAELYGVTGVPETFVIDRQGVIVKKVIGPLAWDSPDVVSFLEGLMK